MCFASVRRVFFPLRPALRAILSSAFAHHVSLQPPPPAGSRTSQAVSPLSSTPPLAGRSASPAAVPAPGGGESVAVIDVDRDSDTGERAASPLRLLASSSSSASLPSGVNRLIASPIGSPAQQEIVNSGAMAGHQQLPQRRPPVVTDEEVVASAAAAGIDVDSEVRSLCVSAFVSPNNVDTREDMNRWS